MYAVGALRHEGPGVEVSIDCKECDGTGEIDCEECDGEDSCEYCCGDTRRECADCDGTGYEAEDE